MIEEVGNNFDIIWKSENSFGFQEIRWVEAKSIEKKIRPVPEGNVAFLYLGL